MAIVVRRKPGDSVGKLIAEFRKKVQRSKLLTKVREKSRYEKDSEKRKKRRQQREYRDKLRQKTG